MQALLALFISQSLNRKWLIYMRSREKVKDRNERRGGVTVDVTRLFLLGSSVRDRRPLRSPVAGKQLNFIDSYFRISQIAIANCNSYSNSGIPCRRCTKFADSRFRFSVKESLEYYTIHE